MRDSGRVSVIQPRYTAHATAAGGVSERNPAKSPIRNANSVVICLCSGSVICDSARILRGVAQVLDQIICTHQDHNAGHHHRQDIAINPLSDQKGPDPATQIIKITEKMRSIFLLRVTGNELYRLIQEDKNMLELN